MQKIQPGVVNEILVLCDQRRQLKQQKYTSTAVGLAYRKINKEVRKKKKAAKEEWTEEQCKDIEKGMMSGNSKEAYNTLKAFTKTQRRRQQWKHPDGKHSYSKLHSDTSLLQSNQTPTQDGESILVLGKRLKRLCAA